MQNIIKQITNLVGGYLPILVGAMIILIIGWLIALIISTIVRKVLHRTELDNQIVAWFGAKEVKKNYVETGISKGVFYLIMLFVLVAFFQTLGITQITEPLNRFLNQLFEYAPKLLGAGALLLVAWLIATVLSMIISKVLGATNIDERLGGTAGLEDEKGVPLTKSLSDAVYWLVFLIFLPAILSPLGLEGILGPIKGMVNKILGFLPNIFTAAIILLIGWFAARIVRKIVTNLLSAIGTDRLGEKVGLSNVLGKQGLSVIVGLILYVFILIPVIIAALNALKIEAITRPASEMLNTILVTLPDIFAAALVLTIAFVVGRVVATFITNLLSGIGFNSVFVWLGVRKEPMEGSSSPSSIVGYLVLVAIMFFAAIEASDLLGFKVLSDLVAQLTVVASHIIFGLIIFSIGLFLANLVSKTIQSTGTNQAGFMAIVAKITILVLVGAMGLRQMGLANEIINLAFGLLLGAVALAIAIAIGIGGREIAARELENWIQSIRSKGS